MAPRVVLFDLGGVLADLGNPARAMGLDVTDDEFWTVWLGSDHVHAFEIGRLDEQEFCARIAMELGQPDSEPFRDRFHQWQLRLFPRVEDMVESIPGDCRIALLSNTNAVHWQQVANGSEVFKHFDHLFLSFETGHYKPGVQAFEDVIRHFGCEPGDILFLDDAEKNVRAARALGIDARQVRGVAEAGGAITTMPGA